MKIKDSQWGYHLILLILVILLLFPIVFAISNSFKTLQESFNNIFAIIPDNPTWENYAYVFQRLPFGKIVFNTFFVAATVSVFKILTSVLCAYAFVYFDFKGKNIIYLLMLSTMFIPFTVTMIPNYMTISKIGMADTLFGVILPQLADVLGIFLLRQSMRSIPRSLIEVAKIDGISHFRIMKDIVVPLVKPALISTGTMFFINSWNEYVWPVLILKSKENYTLSLALQMFMSSEGGTEFPIAMAVAVLTMIIPITLYLIFQKYIISTFISSGMK